MTRQSLRIALAATVLAGAIVVPVTGAVASSSIVVTTLEDVVDADGDCSLREAITAANGDAAVDGCAAGSGSDTITFGVDGAISLASQLPQVTAPLTISGQGAAIDVRDGLPAPGGRGGAINNASTLTLSQLTFSENRASYGGAVANSGTLTVDRVVFNHNGNSQFGGAIYNASTLVVTDSRFHNNYGTLAVAGQASAGGALANAGTATITGATFDGNNADATGGAIWNGGTLTLTNSTLSSNGFTSNFGGGLYNGATATIRYVTFSANRTTIDGGAIYSSDFLSASTTIEASIIANTVAGGDCEGTVVDGGYNVSEDGSCISAATSLSGDPGLGALADNGGPTPTHAFTTSTARDLVPVGAVGCGTSPTTDQRGVARPSQSACDSGAYEYRDLIPPATTITAAPAAPDGLNGWYTSDVLVTVSAVDSGGAGVAETRCVVNPASVPASFDDLPSGCAYAGAGATVSDDGETVIWVASIDNNGNAESPSQRRIDIDGTAPTVTCDTAPTYVLGGSGGSVTATVSDATSGPAQAQVQATADVTSVGGKSAALTGYDLAGNRTDVGCSYLVRYQLIGPIGLKSSYKAGSSLPVRVALASASGARLPDSTAAALASACAVRISLQGSTAVCARYDPTTDEFVATLQPKRPTAPGSAQILVEVMAGSTLVNSTLTPVTLR